MFGGDTEVTRAALQEAVEALIAENRPVSTRIVDFAVLQEVCGFAPDYLPVGQPTRVIQIEGCVGCPCGGTHVEATAELGKLTIVSLKNVKKNLRVKYEMAK